MTEEPSYMMFARSNVRGGAMSSPLVVESLLSRIDRLEAAAALAALQAVDARKTLEES